MKKCSHCKEIKEYSEFNPDKRSKDKYRCYCIVCSKLKNQESYIRNKIKINERNKKYRDENPEKIKEYFSNPIIKEVRKKTQKDYREKNKNKLLEQKKLYYQENKAEIKDRLKSRKYKIAEYEKNRKNGNPLLKMISNIRTSIYHSIKRMGYSKNRNTHDILGCTFEELKIYLESKFEPWMTWENYGLYNGELNYGWDIDHIIPISSAKSDIEIIKLNHFSNLQPLCSKINRVIKRDKINDITN